MQWVENRVEMAKMNYFVMPIKITNTTVPQDFGRATRTHPGGINEGRG
jgi:hypothetical protein